MFALLFKRMPDADVARQDVILGAIGTAALFEIGKFAISFYIGKQGLESTYGASASIAIVLIWVYYSAQYCCSARNSLMPVRGNGRRKTQAVAEHCGSRDWAARPRVRPTDDRHEIAGRPRGRQVREGNNVCVTDGGRRSEAEES